MADRRARVAGDTGGTGSTDAAAVTSPARITIAEALDQILVVLGRRANAELGDAGAIHDVRQILHRAGLVP